MTAPTPKRNTPCPCGSGKKFKHCCGSTSASSGSTTTSQIRQLLTTGQLARAKQLCRQLLTHTPGDNTAWQLLGHIALQEKTPREALTAFKRAVLLQPNHDNFWYLGESQRLLGQLDSAIDSFHRALDKQNSAVAHSALGNCLAAQGRRREAADHYQQALAQQTDLLDARVNLGNILTELGDLDTALEHYRYVIERHPHHWQTLYNLSHTLAQSDRIQDAISTLQQAIQINPKHPELHNKLGTLLADQGKWPEAVACYRHSLNADNGYLPAWDNLLDATLKICDWRTLPALLAELPRIVPIDQPGLAPHPYTIVRLPTEITPADQYRLARRYAQAVSQQITPLSSSAPSTIEERIKIGYLSADFGPHATAHLLGDLFSHHDQKRFSIHGYSLRPNDASEQQRRIASGCDEFVDLSGLSDMTAAQQIRHDGITILVDLNGHTRHARPGILARRPAPIQVAYLGFPGTTGADYMDYVLTDRFVTPPEQQPHFSEYFAYLPHCYQVNDQQRPSPPPPNRRDCGLPETGTVFCCFNHPYKIEPLIFGRWLAILQQIPDSVLWLLRGPDPMAGNLRGVARQHGIDPKRLIFAERQGINAHLARHGCADLFLDTHYYNGHTTASDALWMGLPVLSCPGTTFASRVAGSLLTTLGLNELIAPDLDRYQALAVALAKDTGRLTALRQHLVEQRANNPLFDTPQFAQDLEQRFMVMVERYRQGQPPAPIHN